MGKKLKYSLYYSVVAMLIFFLMAMKLEGNNGMGTGFLLMASAWILLIILTVAYHVIANEKEISRAIIWMGISIAITGAIMFLVNDFAESSHMSYFLQCFLPGVLIMVVNLMFTLIYEFYENPPGSRNV